MREARVLSTFGVQRSSADLQGATVNAPITFFWINSCFIRNTLTDTSHSMSHTEVNSGHDHSDPYFRSHTPENRSSHHLT